MPVIVGATAAGKTATAVAFAKLIDGEIISADSMQIYRHMDIGTAKPTLEEMAGVPHHLIDFVEPDEEYNVARFKDEALATIADIFARGKTPVIVGGTGLYVNALTKPWSFAVEDTDLEIRAQLETEMASLGKEIMHQRLAEVDPITAAELHPNNKKRVIRALEVYAVTGKPKSQLDQEGRAIELPYNYSLLGLKMERELLYERINMRVDMMMAAGLLAEVESLVAAGYHRELVSMKAIGYKEFFPYLDGEIDLAEAVRILKRDTRHFAKRQLTWFRRDDEITWFAATEDTNVQTLTEQMARHYENVSGRSFPSAGRDADEE